MCADFAIHDTGGGNPHAHIIGTISVTITSTNYEDMTATITVNSVNKTPVKVSGVSVTGRTYNGQSLAHSGTPTATLNGTPVTVEGFTY